MKTDRERLLAAADMYRLLSLSFSYPDGETIETLRSLSEEINEGIHCLPFGLQKELRAYADCLHGLSAGAVEGEYTELFMTRMLCPPYETSYGKGGFDKAGTLADIRGFYKAFGLSLSDRDSDMPDHIAVEMEFLSLLALKEAYGIERGQGEMAEVCASAKKGFLRDHLGRWAAAFCRNLHERTAQDFYRSLALLASGFVRGETAFYGLDVESLEELPRETLEPMACPAVDGGGVH